MSSWAGRWRAAGRVEVDARCGRRRRWRRILGREDGVEVHLADLGEVADQFGDADDHRGRGHRPADRVAAADAASASRRPGCRRAWIGRPTWSDAGARRKVMSLSTSTRTPPRPKATSLPKDLVGDGADDDLGRRRPASAGPGRRRCGRRLLYLRARWRGWCRSPARTASAVSERPTMHAAGLGLVQDVGADDLQHAPCPWGLGQGGGFFGRVGHAFLRHAEMPYASQTSLPSGAVRLSRPSALDGIEDLADGLALAESVVSSMWMGSLFGGHAGGRVCRGRRRPEWRRCGRRRNAQDGRGGSRRCARRAAGSG